MSKIKTSILRPTPANFRRVVAALRRGELVAIPTETVYGLAANALDPKACRRIFWAKKRPANDPLIVHVLDLKQAGELAEISPSAVKLAKKFWPGPLTLVLPRMDPVSDVVTSGRDSVAIRSPVHPLARRVLRLTGLPLAAPSANPFGYISPTTAEHVRDGLGGRIKLILDGGPCDVGVESTIVDLRDAARPRILRLGAISAQEISQTLGQSVGVRKTRAPAQAVGAVAPGLLESHYSPRTPLELVRKLTALILRDAPDNSAFIRFEAPTVAGRTRSNFWLSERGGAAEAAQNLYAVLRAADKGGFVRLYIEAAPASLGALAVAINDRLRRATAQR